MRTSSARLDGFAAFALAIAIATASACSAGDATPAGQGASGGGDVAGANGDDGGAGSGGRGGGGATGDDGGAGSAGGADGGGTTGSGGGADPILVGAGDIAACGTDGSGEPTAKLLDALFAGGAHADGVVVNLGDNAYEDGTLAEYTSCYGPSWGRHKARTRPTPGNHEYHTAGAADYFTYFGAAAGPAGRGYYSYDVGAWHVVSLDSEIAVSATSPQVTWLRTDLAASKAKCTLAYWHQSRYSSGAEHGSQTWLSDLWQALYDGGADVVLSAHDHQYERFAPQDAHAKLDAARGIREFLAGMGGNTTYAFASTPQPNSEARYTGGYGVLKLTLHPAGYDWELVSEAGKTFTDTGSGQCH